MPLSGEAQNDDEFQISGVEKEALRGLSDTQGGGDRLRRWTDGRDRVVFEKRQEQPGGERQDSALVLHDEHISVAVQIGDFKGK